MRIVAIGGGGFCGKTIMPDGSALQRPVETMEIDQYLVRMTGMKNPKLLFLATASGDAIGYFDKAYAIDDYAALAFENGIIRSIVSSVGQSKGSKVRQMTVKNGRIAEIDIVQAAIARHGSFDISHTRD
ncbi:MAG: hypothetical protein LBB08_03030 [Rickettsiales bacterium]|jgi:hypothetical protein|nr:hypothetical protein [Rickettsiales bacterium]